MKKLISILLLMLVLVSSCNDDAKKEAEYQAKVEKTRMVLGNHCETDSDCMITGCHNTMCRAMPEPDFCDQRLVLAMDEDDDVPVIREIVKSQLTEEEAETVRIGGYSAGKKTLSFMATPVQRERVEIALNQLSQSGFARLHPRATDYSEALYERLKNNDTTMRSMKGVGKLVERQIRSGDVLSKDDIRNTWTQAATALNEKIGDNDDIELLWGYDVIFGKISQLRFWPVDKRQRISARLWKDLESRTDNGDLILTATLADSVVATLKSWTETQRLVVLMVGNEVVATALPAIPIEDGRFELVIHDGAKNENLKDAVASLQKISQMKGGIRIDHKATQRVERDITCNEQFPRKCGCVRGSCDWNVNPDYNKCLFE
ncbi:MAG: hypothetical protein IJU23_11305 [Proteobacteria bacterium]|nr:hypothetical protein [Pseudomonadota bacterium]